MSPPSSPRPLASQPEHTGLGQPFVASGVTATEQRHVLASPAPGQQHLDPSRSHALLCALVTGIMVLVASLHMHSFPSILKLPAPGKGRSLLPILRGHQLVLALDNCLSLSCPWLWGGA